MFRVISNIIWGIYEDETILHLIIQLINIKVCSYMYRVISNIIWEYLKMGYYF